jgi:uncharacterized protein with PQ loop repeat
MKENIRNLLITISVFGLFAWLQHREDIQNKKKQSSLYEKYKKPLLFAAIVGLILNLNLSSKCTNIFIRNNSTVDITEIEKPPILVLNKDPEMYLTLAKF